MAARTLEYRKAPNFNLTPGSVILGSILVDPASPDDILNKGEIIPIDPAPTPQVQLNYKETVKNVKKGKVGIWARVVQSAHAGAEVQSSAENTDDYEYAFEKLETTSFHPSASYIDEATQKPFTKRYLERTDYAPVYMVTGVKVVRGANSIVKTTVTKRREANAHCGIFATIFGSSVNFGPKADSSHCKIHEVSFGGSSDAGNSSDFIIGYRLRIIKFQGTSAGHASSSEKYLDGALMTDDVQEKSERLSPSVVHVGDETVAQERAWDGSD